tara:strand:+ start:1552 stop:1917 length:366 start_codon:yes stop_codon:yes gene_type:complete
MTKNIAIELTNSPLSLQEIQRIDQVKLSIIEKHHLRLLAHCLYSFKAMSTQSSEMSIPSKEDQLRWCLDNPKLASDEEFINLLLEKFSDAEIYLSQIADTFDLSPLELTLDHLISYLEKKG